MRHIKKPIINKVYKKIKEYDEIVIARHVGPDPDALASQMALKESILLTFPEKKVYAVGVGVAKFKSYGALDKVDFDKLTKPLLITLDVPNMRRVDGIEGLNFDDVLKIDHHPAEDIKGKVDWTEEVASSTCQMVAELILNSKLKLNEKIASNLFLGIISDSDRFVLKNTTMDTFRITFELLEKSKIPFTELYNTLYLRPMNEIKFYAYLTNNLTITENGFGYIEIPLEVFKEYNVDIATASNIINNFNFIKELKVWIFITYEEKTGYYKVNLRSRGPVINTVASKYHGGGHKFASGAKLHTRDEIPMLINDLDELCKEFKSEE